MNLQSKGTGSSLFAAGDVKITTGSLSDYFFVGATAVEIGEALGINSVSGSDYVGVSFGAEAFLKQSGTNSVGKDQKIDTGSLSPKVARRARIIDNRRLEFVWPGVADAGKWVLAKPAHKKSDMIGCCAHSTPSCEDQIEFLCNSETIHGHWRSL